MVLLPLRWRHLRHGDARKAFPFVLSNTVAFDNHGPSTITCHAHAHVHPPAATCHSQVLVYHMQCILATGLVRVHVRDTLLAGLIMFNDFVALFMLTFYWRPSQAKQ